MRKGKRAGKRESKRKGNREGDNSVRSGEEVELLELSLSKVAHAIVGMLEILNATLCICPLSLLYEYLRGKTAPLQLNSAPQ